MNKNNALIIIVLSFIVSCAFSYVLLSGSTQKMKELSKQEIVNISGSGTFYGEFVLVTGDASWVTKNGYTYYAHHAIDPNGRVVYNGTDGYFRMWNHATIQTKNNASGTGTYYIFAYS